jgi:hypothetical protein
MMRGITTMLVLAALATLHVVLLGEAGMVRKSLPSDAGGGFIIPSPVLKITSFEFKGVVSDMLFIKALVFEGSTHVRRENPRIKTEEWQWFDSILTASSDLDPYFEDPYYLANALMTWDGGLIRETNILLEKGTRYRDWDWMLPFYAGFNSFFFLQDNTKAAEFLVTASKRPGPTEQLLSLASRLAFRGKQTENAILFLEAITKKTDDKKLKKTYETRIRALQARLFLERSVSAYKEKFNRTPATLRRMIEKGIIGGIPIDPYGGVFSINPDGEVICSSDHLLMTKQR